MDELTNINIDLESMIKLLTWIGGVVISAWIIRVLTIMNKRQKEHIDIIKKEFEEREKTFEAKSELLELSHLKETEHLQKQNELQQQSFEITIKNLEYDGKIFKNVANNQPQKQLSLFIELNKELMEILKEMKEVNLPEKINKQLINRTININEISNEISSIPELKFNRVFGANLHETLLRHIDIYSGKNYFEIDDKIKSVGNVFISDLAINRVLQEAFSNIRHFSTEKLVKIKLVELKDNIAIIDIVNTTSYPINNNSNHGLNQLNNNMATFDGKVDFFVKNDKFYLRLSFLRSI